MKYWILKCNPEKYDLEKRLAAFPGLTTITWRVKQHANDIHFGDQAFVWQSGTNGGIRALLRVESDPLPMSDLKSELDFYKAGQGLDDGVRTRILATITRADIRLSRHSKIRSAAVSWNQTGNRLTYRRRSG